LRRILWRHPVFFNSTIFNFIARIFQNGVYGPRQKFFKDKRFVFFLLIFAVTSEDSLESKVQNIGEILKATDSKTSTSQRSSPFGKDEMEKIIDLLGQLDLVTEKNDREVILASFEELLEL
jgi:hypothetical protein